MSKAEAEPEDFMSEIKKEPPTKMGQKQYGLLQIQKILRKMRSFQRGLIHPFLGFLHMHLSNPWHPDNSVNACKKKSLVWRRAILDHDWKIYAANAHGIQKGE